MFPPAISTPHLIRFASIAADIAIFVAPFRSSAGLRAWRGHHLHPTFDPDNPGIGGNQRTYLMCVTISIPVTYTMPLQVRKNVHTAIK